MLRKTIVGMLFVCSALSAAAQTNTARSALAKRPVTVRDVIEMTRIGDPNRVSGFTDQGNPVDFSSDGSKFAFVTQKGNIAKDTVEFSILVFRTAEVFNNPRPDMVATFASSSNRPAITRLRWLQDNDSLAFLGEQPGGEPQLYRVSSTSKKIVQLTKDATGVLGYSISGKGDAFVYLTNVAGDPAEVDMPKSGFPITTQRWDDLYIGKRHDAADPRRQLFIKTRRMKAPQPIGSPFASADQDKPGGAISISPSGRYAIVCSFAIAPPAVWGEYRPKFSTLSLVQGGTLRNPFASPLQYLLVDLEERTVAPLLSAPAVRASEGAALFAWTSNDSVLLINTFLPLDSADEAERGERRKSVYAAEVALPERKIVKIAKQEAPFHARKLYSGAGADEFVTNPLLAAWGPPRKFRRGPGGWEVGDAIESAGERNRLVIKLKQGMNDPPKLVASTADGKRSAALLDLNPQFAELSFGHVEPFQWTTGGGYQMEGALYYPPDYVAGRRYPLIIQSHQYDRNKFWPDGPFTTAYAAQPLANRGFVVLQIPGGANPYSDDQTGAKEAALFGTPEEGPYGADQIESAVDELDRKGLIDLTRVGLSGFSRMVYQVLYTLTHPQHHYAAAVVADGVNFGYAGCIFYMADANSKLCERMNGGKPPFGDGLAGWEKEAPNFRLDKIEAPLLLQSILGPLGEWEILSGLKWLKKPVEMLNFYPEGVHELVKPRQRLLSQGSVVDWYCFWIKGEEDPDPAKAEQYKRWRELRKMQQENDAKDRAIKEKPAPVN